MQKRVEHDSDDDQRADHDEKNDHVALALAAEIAFARRRPVRGATRRMAVLLQPPDGRFGRLDRIAETLDAALS